MKSSLNQRWIVCRICLKQPKETMKAIFHKDDDQDLTRMISDCGGVPIKKFDNFPDKICCKCLKYLRVAYKFRVTCQQSHEHLSQIIAPAAPADADKEKADTDTPSIVAEAADDLEFTEAEQMALKLEPIETVGMGIIKQEVPDHTLDDDVIETFEPLDSDAEQICEFMMIDQIGKNVDGDDENLEDIGALFSSSDEDYVPPSSLKKATATKRNATKLSKKVAVKAEKKSARHATTSKRAQAATGTMLTIKVEAGTGTGTGKKRGRKPKSDTAYICDICGNIYPSQGRLTEHIKLHKGIKPHECEICGHAFAQTQQLTRHMNTHTGNRPYKCNYCPAAFADLSTRNKHHRIHTNERPYVCDVCNKSFTYTNTLKFHKMIHTGEKPHVCDICGKGFLQAYKLRNHKVTHEKRHIPTLQKIELEDLAKFHDVTTAATTFLEM